MRNTFLFAMLSLALVSGNVVLAQSPVEYLTKEWERAKAYTKEYLDAMPDSAYGLKPTPEMRSFADQMLHLTGSNYTVPPK